MQRFHPASSGGGVVADVVSWRLTLSCAGVSRMASGTAGLTAMCLLIAVVHVGRLPATRTEVCGYTYKGRDSVLFGTY